MKSIQSQPVYLKTLYFLFFVGLGISSPFFGIFYKHVLVHTDGTPAIRLIGLIFFVMPLVSLIANIPAGVLADKFQSGKRLITLFCFGVSIFALMIGLAGEDLARTWSIHLKFTYIFVLLLFLNAFFYPIMPTLDAETLLFLNRHSRREYYGAYRVWGTYGWSVSSILMGALLFFIRHDPMIFYGAALAFAALGFASWSGIESRPAAAPIIIPWDHLKKDTLFRRFLLFIFLHGVVTTSSFTYVGYFFDDVMKSPMEIGFVLGTIAILCMAASIVMVKGVLDGAPVLWASSVRVFFGGVGLLPALASSSVRRETARLLRPDRSWRFTIPAAALGNYFAMVAWIGGTKYTAASAAAILNQTSTVFIFLFAAVFLKESLTRRRTAALTLAFGGAALVILR